MDGIQAANARVGEITAAFTGLRARAVPAGGAAFADALRSATPAAGAASSAPGSSAATASPITWAAGAFRPPSLRPESLRTPAPTAPLQRSEPASTGPVRLTRSGAPAELAAYGNGKVPAAALTPIGDGHRLWRPAAVAWERMNEAAAAAGVRIGVNDSYRSYEQQVDVAARKGLYSQGGLAAAPGTSSHGWGRSLDLQLDDRAQAWMRANAASFGFAEDVPREPWHWTYTG